MGFGSRSYSRPYLAIPGLPPGIKWLLIVNVGMFLLHLVPGAVRLLFALALVPAETVGRLYVWQLFTYSFVHFDFWEVLWNMLTLWMFASEIEQSWGTERFLKFYMACATGAAAVVVLLGYATGAAGMPVAGSYAPIYGILLVCAVLWPERQVLFIIFPMKMRYFTILVGAIALYFSLSGGVIGLGMLSGMAFAYFFLRLPRMRGWDPMGALDRSYKAWKLERAKRKFQVYLKKQRSDRDIN